MKRASRSAAPPQGVELDLVASVDRAPLVYGADDVVARVASLVGPYRRHPVLVGPSEVGKTAVVWALARAIAQGRGPEGVHAIWQVSLRTLDAQCDKDGAVGGRVREILRAASEHASRPIVYVRDLRCLRMYDAQHELVEALLHTGALFLGEAWPSFSTWLAEDSELASVAHAVRLDEPSAAHTLGLLRLRARDLEASEGVACDDAALERVVAHGERLFPARRFPGKAFALLDEAAREAASQPGKRVTASRVSDRVADGLRLPRFVVAPEARLDPGDLTRRLRSQLVGMDDAVGSVVQALTLHKAELTDPRRPLGVIMLAGPPGVGKTLFARLVAEQAFGGADRLVRVPLAEYSEDWKVDQLFGQRGSSSGDARRGVLSRLLAGKPFSVLLLDEVDKAHPIFFKHLLRPLDEGVFVNGGDEEVSLRNCLVLMTTSVAAEVYRDGVGFSVEALPVREASVRKRLADALSPDVLDRVDRVCVCPPLRHDELREVARRELCEVLERAGFRRRGVRVEVDEAVYETLAGVAAAAGAAGGARAVRRAIERAVIHPLARYVVETDPPAGSEVRVTVREGAVVSLGEVPALPQPERGELKIPRPVGGAALERVERMVASNAADALRPVAEKD